MSIKATDLVVTFNGVEFILGWDMAGPQLEGKDLGQPELDALGPFTRPPVPRFTPNHRKHNKRGKFKRTGK